MVRSRLGVEDLARMHFAVSPLQELLFSLWPSRHVHYRRSALGDELASASRTV